MRCRCWPTWLADIWPKKTQQQQNQQKHKASGRGRERSQFDMRAARNNATRDYGNKTNIFTDLLMKLMDFKLALLMYAAPLMRRLHATAAADYFFLSLLFYLSMLRP